MSKSKYVMNAEEKRVVSNHISTLGTEGYYDVVRNNAILSMDNIGNTDEVFLDMSETMLEEGRAEKDEEIKKIYYSASYIFRKVAHEVNRILISQGKEPSDRFLYLASYNKDAPII